MHSIYNVVLNVTFRTSSFSFRVIAIFGHRGTISRHTRSAGRARKASRFDLKSAT